jgi:hypothetical protein
MDDSGSLPASNKFFLVKFSGTQLGDLNGQAFVYSQSVKEKQASLAGRVMTDLKLRFPQAVIEHIPADLDSESRLVFLCSNGKFASFVPCWFFFLASGCFCPCRVSKNSSSSFLLFVLLCFCFSYFGLQYYGQQDLF